MATLNDIPWTTPQLLLRPYLESDAPALFAFMRDPVAMRYTYVAASLQDCSDRLGTYEAMRGTLGFAPWVACLRESGEVVGWGGPSLDPEEPAWGLEVRYAFAPTAWGRGLATELVQASMAFAFVQLQAPEVHAFARPENARSLQVLRKCGFEFLRHEASLQRDHYRALAPPMA